MYLMLTSGVQYALIAWILPYFPESSQFILGSKTQSATYGNHCCDSWTSYFGNDEDVYAVLTPRYLPDYHPNPPPNRLDLIQSVKRFDLPYDEQPPTRPNPANGPAR